MFNISCLNSHSWCTVNVSWSAGPVSFSYGPVSFSLQVWRYVTRSNFAVKWYTGILTKKLLHRANRVNDHVNILQSLD